MNIQADKLTQLVAAIFARAGCSTDEAETIARHLVDSNLVGHDSHGVIRVSRYIRCLEEGQVRANQSAKIAFESDAMVLIDAHRGFGQVIGEQVVAIGVERAEKFGAAVVGVREVAHIGRVGDWAEMAAAAGKISLHFVGTSGIAVMVVPFGGSDRRLSPCPISVGIPRGDQPPIILDITTSMAAEGKVFVAKNKGVPMPEGYLIDKDGQPTTDPNDLYAGGALLPFGGHKGSGLCIIADILAGALTGAGTSQRRDKVMLNTWLGIYVDPGKYPDPAGFAAEANRFVDWVKASPPATPGGEVMVPGDIERRTRAERQQQGIPLDEMTWTELTTAAHSTGLTQAEIDRLVA